MPAETDPAARFAAAAERARAVLAAYTAEDAEFCQPGARSHGRIPDYVTHAIRMAAALETLLAEIERTRANEPARAKHPRAPGTWWHHISAGY